MTITPDGETTPATTGDDLAASPFLPGTNIQYAWDSTSLGYLKRCPRLYWYQMIEGWRPKEDNAHLRFGQEYHSALEHFDKRRHEGMGFEENLRTTVRDTLIRMTDWDPDHQYKNKRTLIRSIVGYLDKFRNDRAETYVLEDGKLACELSFRFELDWGPSQTMNHGGPINDGGGQMDVVEGHYTQPYLLCGHLDRVVTFNGELFVMDRKTGKTKAGSYYFDSFEPENQMSFYTLAGQILFDTTVRGVIIDYAQITIESGTAFERGFTYRTVDQTNEWINDLHFWFALAEQYAVANVWPMNDTACDKYGGCKFRKICAKSPQVREKFLKADFVKEEPWNPLKVR